MIGMFIIIEDKPAEQQAAYEAVKRSLGEVVEAHESWGSHAGFAWTMALKRVDGSGGTLVWIASNLRMLETVMSPALRFLESGAVSKINVLTDLMFPMQEGGKEEPNGLLIIAKCIEKGLPVVVCSDTDHHDVKWLCPVFPLLGKAHPAGQIPVILDKKDWDKAVALLAETFA
ncbi:MAG: hypothetical protein JWL75_73 [Parcubacteria group bacterium]|nr:hypothetical protein [Parcubacteria group bacterium]